VHSSSFHDRSRNVTLVNGEGDGHVDWPLNEIGPVAAVANDTYFVR
jgi:hypothetical protein